MFLAALRAGIYPKQLGRKYNILLFLRGTYVKESIVLAPKRAVCDAHFRRIASFLAKEEITVFEALDEGHFDDKHVSEPKRFFFVFDVSLQADVQRGERWLV